MVSHPDRMTWSTASVSSSPMSTSASGIFHSVNVELPPHARESIVCGLQILRPPDVEPISVPYVRRHPLPAREQTVDQFREIEVAVARTMLERTGLVHVDAHAHAIGQLRFLDVGSNPALVVGLDGAKVDLDLPPGHRDRQHRPGAAVMLDELAIVQVRQDVPVHGEKRLAQARNTGERAGRTGWLTLVGKIDLHSVEAIAPALQICVDQFAEMTYRQRDPLEPEIP